VRAGTSLPALACLAALALLPTRAAAQAEADIELPRPRPSIESTSVPPAPPKPSFQTQSEPAEASPEPAGPVPPASPPRIYQTACPAVMTGEVVGVALPPISDGLCVVASPLSITALRANGREIALTSPVTLDCGMASQLPKWAAGLDSWLMATQDTRLAAITTGTSYMCRGVNNAAGGNLSFHAFGNALDVSGFSLEDGRQIDVLTAWPDDAAAGSKIVRHAHQTACGLFMTVLGPEANALHADHLHLDLGCHGKSCVARICE
jgi:hypothetical protein